MRLDIGGRINAPEGYKTLDKQSPADFVMDLEDCDLSTLGYGEWEEVRACDVLEHIDPKKLGGVMDEVWKLLKDDGQFFIEVPLAGTPADFSDPTHVGHFTEATFDYFRPFLNYFGYVKYNWEYLDPPHIISPNKDRIRVILKKVL